MSRGRCPGCGFEDASCKKVRNHMNTCAEVVALYQSNPSAVIDPEDEFVRHKAYLESPEHLAEKEARRLAVRQGHIESARARQERQKARWSGAGSN